MADHAEGSRLLETDVPMSEADSFLQDQRLYGTLSSWEEAWRDRQQFLQSCGYMLRPRYHPDWVPSWLKTGERPHYFEDAMALPLRRHLIDATRISDDKRVYIKRVKTGDDESRIAIMLSEIDDPTNHCVPILEVLQDPDDEDVSYMIMPFLRLMNNPPFDSVGEVVDFADQILEGLVFLHKNGVAHRDCVQYNLMMDANLMYPFGFHPVDMNALPEYHTVAFHRPRSVVSVKYYFVDFGISSSFSTNDYPKLALGVDGRDQEVPELSNKVPYDPFKVDIFIIGNLFRQEFYNKYSNLSFLLPLIDMMTQKDPAARPDAAAALEHWRGIRRWVFMIHRIWRPWPREEPAPIRVVMDPVSLAYRMFHFSRRILGMK